MLFPLERKDWLRGLDSNQDNQIQSLVCCQLHHPGVVWNYAVKSLRLRCAGLFCTKFELRGGKFSTRFA